MSGPCGLLQSDSLPAWLQGIGAIGALFFSMWLLASTRGDQLASKVHGLTFGIDIPTPIDWTDPQYKHIKEKGQRGLIRYQNRSTTVVRRLHLESKPRRGSGEDTHVQLLEPFLPPIWPGLTSKEVSHQVHFDTIAVSYDRLLTGQHLFFLHFLDQSGNHWRVDEEQRIKRMRFRKIPLPQGVLATLTLGNVEDKTDEK